MSVLKARAIERLDDPQQTWPTIYGPAAVAPGQDPVVQNSLHTLELGAIMMPVKAFQQQLERDMTAASFGAIDIDVNDATGSLADSLGPGGTLGTTGRYYGPWLEVREEWNSGANSVVRGLFVLEETTLQWHQAEGLTKFSVTHASNIARQILLSDLGILRPVPNTPSTSDTSFIVTTGDDLLYPGVALRSNRQALEQAKWATGQISWKKYLSIRDTMPPPMPLSGFVNIAGTLYAVESVIKDPDPYLTYVSGTEAQMHFYSSLIVLAGAPDLSHILSFSPASSIIWAGTTTPGSDYKLLNGVVAPISGADGQTYLDIDGTDQLVPGDDLNISQIDASTTYRRLTDLQVKVVDTDGETNRVHLLAPLQEGINASTVQSIVRMSQEPALIDGVALARTIISPFLVDTTYLYEVATSVPVMSWEPTDQAEAPYDFFGLYMLQPLHPTNGQVQLSKRNGSTTPISPGAGVFQGRWGYGGTWTWQGFGVPADPSLPNRVLGNATQWPGGQTTLAPATLYVKGDLSGGATIPPDGWWNRERSLDRFVQGQSIPSKWDGSNISYGWLSPTSNIPGDLYAYYSGASPGRFRLHSDGTFHFAAHVSPSTFGAETTITPTGSLPSSVAWIQMGMGLWNNGSAHVEAVMALAATGGNNPWSKVQACLLSVGSSGALTLQGTVTLYDTTITPHDPDGAWGVGGGIVVHTWQETVDNLPFAHSKLFLVDGASLTASQDFPGMEIIPGTICPLSFDAVTHKVNLWAALALESYSDSSKAVRRRARFIQIDNTMSIINGALEPNPLNPFDGTTAFKKGTILRDPVGTGAIPAVLRRTGTGTDLQGILGGFAFRIRYALSRTVGRVKIGDAVPRNQVVSGLYVPPVSDQNGQNAGQYMDQLGLLLLANAIPQPDGSIAYVSRTNGPVQVRSVGGGMYAGVQESEKGEDLFTTQVANDFTREVRVTYDNSVLGTTERVRIPCGFRGGRPITVGADGIIDNDTEATAIAQILADFFGHPRKVWKFTATDQQIGVVDQLPPAFYAAWNVGDIVPATAIPAGLAAQTVWKIHSKEPDFDARSCIFEMVQLPSTVTFDPSTLGAHYANLYADNYYQ